MKIQETGLVKFDEAMHALEKAATIDEVKSIRDKAEAARVYAKQALASLSAQNMLAEIKIRAERKAGKILKDIEKNKGGQPSQKNQSHDATSSPTLKDMGITKDQSSRWQMEAEVSDEELEEIIEEANENEVPLTSAKVQKRAKENRETQAKRPKAIEYSVIVVPEDFHVNSILIIKHGELDFYNESIEPGERIPELDEDSLIYKHHNGI